MVLSTLDEIYYPSRNASKESEDFDGSAAGSIFAVLVKSLASLNYDLRHNLDSFSAHQTLESLFQKMDLVTRLLEEFISQHRFWNVPAAV